MSTPDSYPAPHQHRPFRAQSLRPSEFFSLDAPQLRSAVVKDVVVDGEGSWRWTGPDPELRFTLSSTDDRTLLVEFVVHDRTFRETGPLTISFFVNGNLAGQERYATHGDHTFQKAIPPEWLSGKAETRVHLHIHNPWTSPDGERLGVLLKRIGFVE